MKSMKSMKSMKGGASPSDRGVTGIFHWAAEVAVVERLVRLLHSTTSMLWCFTGALKPTLSSRTTLAKSGSLRALGGATGVRVLCAQQHPWRQR